MSDKTYRITEIVGTSTESVEAAVQSGIARAAQTLHGLDWFEVTQIRGAISAGEIVSFQVGIKVGFLLDDGPD